MIRSILRTSSSKLSAFSPGKRLFSYYAPYAGGPAPASAVSKPLVIAGGAALMFGTYYMLDKALNVDTQFTRQFGSYTSTTVQDYMFQTYKYVAGGLAITAASATMAYRSGFAHRVAMANPWMVMIGGLVCTVTGSILTTSTSPENVIPKHAYWAFTTASVGAISLSTLGFLPTALVARAGLYTLGIVTSLSAVAMNAKHDAFLSLGGPMFIGLGFVFLAGVSTLFLPAGGRAFTLMNNVSLYGGLGVFSLLMLYDTQMTLQRARSFQNGMHYGRKPDYINESFGVYWNTLNIFIRMVQILALGNQRRK